MILIRGARQLLTLQGPPTRRGYQLRDLSIIPDGSVLIDGETIREVGTTRRLENLRVARDAEVIEAAGKVVLPSFVDFHAQIVFASTPLDRPAPLQPMGSQAGSPRLHPSWDPPPRVRSRSQLTQKALRLRAKRWLERFAVHGTTTLETRSLYGTELGSEQKALQIARSLDDEPLEVAATFAAGAPEPDESLEHPDLAVDEIVEMILPSLSRRRLAQCCEVDCDPDVFGVEGSRRILQAAQKQKLRVRVEACRRQGDEGVNLAVEADALSADHLLFAGEDEIDRLAGSSTMAGLLPGVSYHRGVRFAPARALIDRGAAIALATGFSPAGCPTVSMPMVLSLACSQMGLHATEAIAAATANGAAAMGLSKRLGALEPGRQADIAIFDVPDCREIPYYFGFNLCVMTIRKGRVIYSAPGFRHGIGGLKPMGREPGIDARLPRWRS